MIPNHLILNSAGAVQYDDGHTDTFTHNKCEDEYCLYCGGQEKAITYYRNDPEKPICQFCLNDKLSEY